MFNLALIEALRRHRKKVIGITIVVVVATFKACS
jgi:uncharacterized protein involved in exopolysaccharide biosynthesis